MAALIIPRRYLQQPSSAVDVNWNNPYARSLAFAWLPRVGSFDLVSRVPAVLDTGASYRYNYFGDEIRTIQNGYTRTGAAFGAGTVAASNKVTIVYVLDYWTASGGIYMPIVSLGGNGLGLDSTGHPKMWKSGGNSANTSTRTIATGTPYVLGGTFNYGDGAYFYINGIGEAKSADSGFAFSGSVNEIGGVNGQGTVGCGLAAALVFKEVFGPGEIPDLLSAPYQVFTRSPRRIISLGIASGFAVSQDHTIPTDWLAAARMDSGAPAEWIAQMKQDAAVPADTLASVRQDHAIPLDFLLASLRDNTVPVAWSASLREDVTAPTEWTGAISVTQDQPMPLDWMAPLRLDPALAAEWLLSLQDSVPLALDLSTSVRADAVSPAETVVTARRDARIMTEWQGAIAVTADQLVPLEWRAGVAADAPLQLAFSAALVTDRPIPAAFGTGFIADQTAAIEWLRAVFGDVSIPAGTLAIVRPDVFAPLEFGGTSPFLFGNVHVFHIDARGQVFRIDARGRVFHIDARGRGWKIDNR